LDDREKRVSRYAARRMPGIVRSDIWRSHRLIVSGPAGCWFSAMLSSLCSRH
jgi:hypothetical protein